MPQFYSEKENSQNTTLTSWQKYIRIDHINNFQMSPYLEKPREAYYLTFDQLNSQLREGDYVKLGNGAIYEVYAISRFEQCSFQSMQQGERHLRLHLIDRSRGDFINCPESLHFLLTPSIHNQPGVDLQGYAPDGTAQHPNASPGPSMGMGYGIVEVMQLPLIDRLPCLVHKNLISSYYRVRPLEALRETLRDWIRRFT